MVDLKAATKSIYFRVNERSLRPLKLDELKEVLNASDYFLISARNLTGEDKPLTEVEVTSLEKLINSTYVSKIENSILIRDGPLINGRNYIFHHLAYFISRT